MNPTVNAFLCSNRSEMTLVQFVLNAHIDSFFCIFKRGLSQVLITSFRSCMRVGFQCEIGVLAYSMEPAPQLILGDI